MKHIIEQNPVKTALSIVSIYTAIMGIGMYLVSHSGYTYGDPGMMFVLVWFEIVLSVLALVAAIQFFGWKLVGFRRLNRKNLWWLAIPALVVLVICGEVFPHIFELTTQQWVLFGTILLTTFLVGFSEEVVYRGVVLRALISRYALGWAMLGSAVLFSLLHGVNILAGATFGAVGMQLFFTFLFGLFAAPLTIKLNNLWPIIVFHFLWDFVVFSGILVEVESPISLVVMIYIPVAAIILWISVLREVPHKTHNKN